MKRIVYILVNKEGEIFGETYLENQIFSSEKKAQKQISYWNKHKVSNEQNEEENWTIKRIVLNNYSHMQQFQYKSIGELRVPHSTLLKVAANMVLYTFCLVVYGYVTLNPLLHTEIVPKVQSLLIFNTYLAGLAITLVLISLLHLMKCFIFFSWDINSWFKYKKENTEGLEIFQMLPYLLLTKIDEGERGMIYSKTSTQLKKERDNESNKKITE
ncbi:hypothetical protein ACFSJM_08680 [Lactococcus formosensis subsp. bovis]|uniref:hypothetical protein n=1 Tax=Lactococcus formosensis TaxID=1281486 RepID=UPI001BD0812A|nr:hypothetical protein [Lactococcus formosensis]